MQIPNITSRELRPEITVGGDGSHPLRAQSIGLCLYLLRLALRNVGEQRW